MPATLPSLTGMTASLNGAGLLHIVFNTPKTLNSFDAQRYEDLLACLRYAEKEEAVKVVLLTSTGKYFSSGAALAQGTIDAISKGEKPSMDTSGARRYIDALIDFPKLLITIVQGPAYGIAVTMLPYFDLVYATPEATFTTPFSRIAISLEGCSSVLFPAFFGHALSTRLLLLSDTVTIEEVARSGFLAEVLPKDTVEGTVLKKIEFWLSDLAYRSVLASRRLVRNPKLKKMLHDVNNAEMEVLAERRGSEDHREALLRFQARKKAKKGAGSAKL